MYKTNTELIAIDAKATEPIPTNVVFWSHDKGTAKMIFELQKNHVDQSLATGTKVPILLEFDSATAENGRGKHTYFATIDDAVNGIVSIVLEDNILGYVGRVDGSIYIELPDSRSLDTAGRFTFHIKRSPIDEDVPELEDYYWQGFSDIMEQYHESITEIKLEAKTTLDGLTADVNTAKTKVTQLEQSIATANTNLNTHIDEINKKIDDNDVFTKAESSANVIDQIGGAESAILKKELLVDGTESTAQRYIKDIPNLALDDPLYNEYGVVPGQPNLLTGTSNKWLDYSLTYFQYGNITVPLTEVGLSAGDNFSFSSELDNTSGEVNVRSYIVFLNADKGAVYTPTTVNSIAVGSTGTSYSSGVVPEGAEYITWSKVARNTNPQTPNVGRVRNHKLIKGTKEAMDHWTPHQSGSGLTIVNDGMVPFSNSDYTLMQSADDIVKAETKIYGRGAEIETPFKIIEVFANRYPDIFGKTTTDAEKIARFKSIQKGVTIKGTIRGSGTNNSKYGQLYLKHTDGTSEFLVNNQTSEFAEISKTLTSTQLDQLSSTGVLTFYATTKRNGTNDAGATSDGVTSALLEVKDLRLIVEIEANGKTIIESMIAQNHVENLATQEEAESGTDNAKTMTPLRTAQAVDNRAVTLASNQTVGGIKNFKDGLQVAGKNIVLTHGLESAYADKNSTPESFSDGTLNLYRKGDTVFLTGSIKLSAGKNNQGIWFNLPAWAKPVNMVRLFFRSTNGDMVLLTYDPTTYDALVCADNVVKDQWLIGSGTWLAKDSY